MQSTTQRIQQQSFQKKNKVSKAKEHFFSKSGQNFGPKIMIGKIITFDWQEKQPKISNYSDNYWKYWSKFPATQVFENICFYERKSYFSATKTIFDSSNSLISKKFFTILIWFGNYIVETKIFWLQILRRESKFFKDCLKLVSAVKSPQK